MAEMAAAVVLSSGPPVGWLVPAATSAAMWLSSRSALSVGWLVPAATSAAMWLSSGWAVANVPTEAATALSSGPLSARRLGCACSATTAWSLLDVSLPIAITSAMAATAASASSAAISALRVERTRVVTAGCASCDI